MPTTTLTLWILRVAWAVLAVAAAPACAGALDGRSGAVQVVAALGLWAGWALALVAMLVPSPTSLTIVRVLAPGAPAATIVAACAGAGAVAAVVAIGLGLLAAIVAFTAEVGCVFVQASAYGDESRFLLRPPGPLVVGPLEVAWLVLAAAVGVGPLLVAARQWVLGGLCSAAAVGLAVILARRFHRLSLRWFVFVPAGAVVRDSLVLAETAMFRRATLAAIRLAPAGTAATDLTAKALGPAIEVILTATATVTIAGTLSDPTGRTVAVSALLVSPSRPGRLLAEAARRNYAAVPPPTTISSPES